MNKKVDKGNLSVYEQNKREMFDGMRAYHASEQQHKHDAINFMKTILGVTVAAHGAVLGSFVTPELHFEYTTPIAWVIAFVSIISSYIVVNSTNKKIEADHSIYKAFGSEYTRLCQILELDQPVDVNGTEIIPKKINPEKPIGQGLGYKKTMHIVSETGFAIGAISIMLAIITTFARSGGS